jgi:hypothetical protein
LGYSANYDSNQGQYFMYAAANNNG